MCAFKYTSAFLTGVAYVGLAATGLVAAAQTPSAPAASRTAAVRTFDSAKHAADALIEAADQFDINALEAIFGADVDLVLTGNYAEDRQRAKGFVEAAEDKQSVSIDPKTRARAFLIVGDEDWPFPVPIVKRGQTWSFDARAGRQELLYRRIGADEFDAIAICRGYVEAQHEYALEPRNGFDVNQYAQRVISTPGTHDGLAWKNDDGSWGGTVGEAIANAIQQGYTNRSQPYHGYYFKMLPGQGPAAPLGQLDFVVNGAMIGGFALVAAPAQYGVSGVKTFMVSHDGVVYQKDLGPATLDEFAKMTRFNPDKSWKPVATTD
jgi:hypothetical protein